MGKDSKYYKEKKKEQTLKLRELIRQLPGFAADYIHSKEVTTQTSTLISYSYDRSSRQCTLLWGRRGWKPPVPA